jgi:Tol biopolymer transport system component/DNA-binding winged helix-turn-helix (wHTH) protein
MSLLLNHLVEFGPFVFDLQQGGLSREGRPVELPPRAVSVLRYLIQHRDHTVSKLELNNNLWPDIHLSPNAIDKQVSDLRLVLESRRDASEFIETEYKRGWRFVAAVKDFTPSAPVIPETADQVPTQASEEEIVTETATPAAKYSGKRSHQLIATISGCAFCIFVLVALSISNDTNATVVGYEQLTKDGRNKRGPILTDGIKIFFVEQFAEGLSVATIPVGGGPIVKVPIDGGPFGLLDISPDRHSLLVVSVGLDGESLWTVPTEGGEPKRLMAISGQASWSPDKKLLAVALEKSDHISFNRADDNTVSSAATVSGQIQAIRWSPDSTRVRLSVFDPTEESKSIWEVNSGGGNPQKLKELSRGKQFAEHGNWSRDGKFYFYAGGSRSNQDLLALFEPKRLVGSLGSRAVALTDGMGDWDWPLPLLDQSSLAAIRITRRAELAEFDPGLTAWRAKWNSLPASELDYSRDGKWIAFTHLPDHTIWKCRADGSAQTRLTDSDVEAHEPHWSPDGTRIAYTGKTKTGKWQVYVVPAGGGSSERLLESENDQGVPTWSGDGRYIVMGDRLGRLEGPEMAIHLLDVATRDLTDFEHSNGLWSPRWSPDGKVVAALTCDSKAIRVHAWPGEGWSEIARMQFIDHATWSADSKYLYFNGRPNAQTNALFRINLVTRRLEQLADLKDFFTQGESWFGVSPDGALLGLRGVVSEDIWSLKLRLP